MPFIFLLHEPDLQHKNLQNYVGKRRRKIYLRVCWDPDLNLDAWKVGSGFEQKSFGFGHTAIILLFQELCPIFTGTVCGLPGA
jgi:hypothetical protein